MNAIQKAVDLLGGYEATGRVCDRSGKAVMKWAKKGRLPRTEWTGETCYARLIIDALPADKKGRKPLQYEQLVPTAAATAERSPA